MAHSRVLITGSQGFVGAHVAELIAREEPSWDVVRLGGRRTSGADRSVDISNSEAVAAAIFEIRPTKVVHLASVTTVREAVDAPRETWAINLGGTLNVYWSLADYCPDAHLLLASSAEVYGARSHLVALDENTPIAPDNPYAASKASAELAVRQRGIGNLKTTVARPFTHVGPGQSDRFALSAFASQIVAIERRLAEPVLRVGSLDDYRDITDVRDVARAYLSILRNEDAASGQTYNIAFGVSHRMGDLLEALLRLTPATIRIETDPQRIRDRGVSYTLGDSSKAAKNLGWKPEISIEQTLRDILGYWRERPA